MRNNIVFINDIHFGIADSNRLYSELNDIFIPFIKNNDVDIIFIGGDYFDHKFTFYEPFSVLAVNFFNRLIEICQLKNIKLRIIEGTQSHDRFQPKIFNEMVIGKNVDFKYYENVAEETLNDMNILYVPEEYPMNIDEYYKDYKTHKYDLMIVHGTWDFINFGSAIDNNRNDINTAPVFKYSEWKSALEHGVAICGHIHGRHGYRDKSGEKIIYPGSFTAWSFDQISDRGFLYGTFDTEKHELKYQFINNTQCPTYSNLNLADLDKDFENMTIDEIKDLISKKKEKTTYIKIDINNLSESKKAIFKDLYKTDKTVTIDVEPKKLLLESAADIKKYEKYNYLLKDNLTIEKAIARFMKEEYDIELTEEKIKSIITE